MTGEDDAGLEARLAKLDLKGKVRLLTGASMFTLHGDESIGLEPMAFSDGPTGVRGLDFTGGPLTCLLPNATLLASSWSTDAMDEVGRILAEEAERQQVHVVLGPTVNLHRTPLGGRLFEAYSEDPLLTGVLAAAYVGGLQSQGIGACVKHLVANESETDRHTVNSVVDEQTLRDVYLLPFRIAVEDADAWSVMAAYNDVNGIAATEHGPVINGILKGEWGWDGLVMSDWFATKTTAPSANGGLDLVMPGPHGPWGGALVKAVRDGEVAEEVVDDHVRRLLRLASRVGALDGPRAWRDVPAPDSELRREQLTRLAASGMTVLANDDATLPLERGARVRAHRPARPRDHVHGRRVGGRARAVRGEHCAGADRPDRRRHRGRRRRGAEPSARRPAGRAHRPGDRSAGDAGAAVRRVRCAALRLRVGGVQDDPRPARPGVRRAGRAGGARGDGARRRAAGRVAAGSGPGP